MHISDYPDAVLVALTARALEISEHALFVRAWETWYGEAPTDAAIARLFRGWLLQGNLPFVVRAYCRQYLENQPGDWQAWLAGQRKARTLNWVTTGLLGLFVTLALLA